MVRACRTRLTEPDACMYAPSWIFLVSLHENPVTKATSMLIVSRFVSDRDSHDGNASLREQWPSDGIHNRG